MTPTYAPPSETRRAHRSTLEEFRSVEAAVSGARRKDGRGVAPVSASSAFWSYALTGSKNALDLSEQRALSKATGAGGGFLVPLDLEQQIVSAGRAASAIATLASELVTTSGSTLSVPTAPTHGVATWAAENAASTPSDEVLTEVVLGAYKAITKVIVSEELARDARIPFDEYLADEVGRRLGALEGAAFASGSGTGMPQGLAGALAAVGAATGSATAFKLADLTALYNGVPAAYRPRASWVMHPGAFSSLASLADSGGALVLPSLHAAEPSLFGRPVVLDAYLPSPAAGARSVVFGDIATAYVVRRVGEVTLQRQDQLHSDNGQIGFRARERVDGRVVLADAARALAHSAT